MLAIGCVSLVLLSLVNSAGQLNAASNDAVDCLSF